MVSLSQQSYVQILRGHLLTLGIKVTAVPGLPDTYSFEEERCHLAHGCRGLGPWPGSSRAEASPWKAIAKQICLAHSAQEAEQCWRGRGLLESRQGCSATAPDGCWLQNYERARFCALTSDIVQLVSLRQFEQSTYKQTDSLLTAIH